MSAKSFSSILLRSLLVMAWKMDGQHEKLNPEL